MQVRPFRDGDRFAVLALWETCGLTGPWNPPEGDLNRALAGLSNEAALGFYDRLGYEREPVAVCSRWLTATDPRTQA